MIIEFRPVILVLILFTGTISTLDNGLARTPPMGWMTWERFRCNVDCIAKPKECINEDLIMTQAFELKKLGLLASGYEYVVIDDCWLNKTRDKFGNLIPDPIRFPNGMKFISDFLHSLGFKFGLYEDYGTKTCGGYPGVLNNMKKDVDTFVSWGVDYIKLDGCYSIPSTQPTGYATYGRYLNESKRPIVFSCSWPAYFNVKNINKTNLALLQKSCNLWRLYSDIQDSWQSVLGIINYYKTNPNNFRSWAGPGHWNDPDMLIIGDSSLSPDQQRVQMGMWAIFAAPLLMSNDLRNISASSLELLQNKNILAINQDKLGQQGMFILEKDGVQVWRRDLTGKQAAVAVFNSGARANQLYFSLYQIGLRENREYVISDAFVNKNTLNVGLNTIIRVDIDATSLEMILVK